MRIACLLADGFEELEAIGTIDLLRRSGITVDLFAFQNGKSIVGSHGIVVSSEWPYSIMDTQIYDGILIPGGGKQSETLRNDESVRKMVQDFHKNGKWLMAICAGPTVFGAAGLMKNIHYTSFPGTEKHIPGGIKEEKSVVVDGKIITGAGAGATIEFALAIIETLLGSEKKAEMANRIVFRTYERR